MQCINSPVAPPTRRWAATPCIGPGGGDYNTALGGGALGGTLGNTGNDNTAVGMITEIVDEALVSDLKKAGISDDDARHLMYAVHNKCDRFVTLDNNDLLPNRSTAAPLCRGMKIMMPSELMAELEAS